MNILVKELFHQIKTKMKDSTVTECLACLKRWESYKFVQTDIVYFVTDEQPIMSSEMYNLINAYFFPSISFCSIKN
jgi:hypothetical protein